jgi:ATP-dependent RNA helicase RhlE
VPEDYVHRIGRTGRAGSSGAAISFVDSEERSFLTSIERLIKRNIDRVPLPEFVTAPIDPNEDVRPPRQPRQPSRRKEGSAPRTAHPERPAPRGPGQAAGRPGGTPRNPDAAGNRNGGRSADANGNRAPRNPDANGNRGPRSSAPRPALFSAKPGSNSGNR